MIICFFAIIKNRHVAVFECSKQILTLAELCRTTRFANTVVLTFNNTAVACQEARRLQNCAQFRFRLFQGFGNTVFYRARLAGQTTAQNKCMDVICAVAFCNAKKAVR